MPNRRRRQHSVCCVPNRTWLSPPVRSQYVKYNIGMDAAAISVGAIHPVLTLGQAFCTGLPRGKIFKIGPAVSLNPKGEQACVLLDISHQWSITRVLLKLMLLILEH